MKVGVELRGKKSKELHRITHKKIQKYLPEKDCYKKHCDVSDDQGTSRV
jgi:hypothetical protein